MGLSLLIDLLIGWLVMVQRRVHNKGHIHGKSLVAFILSLLFNYIYYMLMLKFTEHFEMVRFA